MISPKVALVFGLSAGIAVAIVEVAAGVGLTGNPILDGVLGGGSITLAAATVYKLKVDRLEKQIDAKADKDTLNAALDRIYHQLDQIQSHLMK
jgi:hypothetical protein